MWTTKEVLVVSIVTGLAFCFATVYTQRKIQRYIDGKVSERSATNPLASLLGSGAPPSSPLSPLETQRDRAPPVAGTAAAPPPRARVHEKPPGAGERWTPLPIAV